MESDSSQSFKKILTYFLVFVFGAIFWVWLSSPMVVTVTGTGEVSVPATSATVSFSATSNDATSQGAISIVKAKATNLRQMLLTSGILEEDIVESQLTVVPASLVTPGTGGYQAQIVMGIKTIHVTNISDLISNLYNQGVTVVSQPILAVEDIDELEAKAVDEALKDAKKEANKIGLKNFKFIKKMVAMAQQSSESTSTTSSKADAVTQATSGQTAQNGVFKIVKAVAVSYKMW